MRLLFKRTEGIGDILMLSGCIAEARRRYPNNEIVLQSKCPEVARFMPDVDLSVNYDIKADIVCDMNMVYEKTPTIPVWVAYAKHLFETFNEQDIMPKIKVPPRDGHNGKWAVVHACKSFPSRTLPKSKWELIVQGLQFLGYRVLVVGSGDDFRLDSADGNLIDELSLMGIAEHISNADLFVGIDSGIMHIAQGTDTPIIGIFSVASPEYRVWRKDKFFAVVPLSDCRFCLAKRQPTQAVWCDELDCVRSITIDEVLMYAQQV